ncbi:hypothetical protein D4R30_00385 [archaeon]|nr:MAG: hypothetical protein D4R30_00385 [archaeon]
MSNVDAAIARLEDKVDQVLQRVAHLEGKADMGKLIIQWVVLPLIMILGAIIGVKVILPSV